MTSDPHFISLNSLKITVNFVCSSNKEEPPALGLSRFANAQNQILLLHVAMSTQLPKANQDSCLHRCFHTERKILMGYYNTPINRLDSSDLICIQLG